ncbi:MAG: ROK family protein [Chloroflexota bacterium]|nr:ROK family protein [Chloroflexota bacterium]
MQNRETTTEDTSTLPLVVAVDLGGTQIRTAVLRGSTLLSRVGLLTGEVPTPERVIPRIYAAIQQALDEAQTTLDFIAGIGIGAPGPLDSRTGIVYDPPNLPGWERVPLRDMFQEHFQVPVVVENDANAAALGEYMFGAGRGSKNLVYMTISTGIGGGVILNGSIIEGASGTAAELGHMTIDRYGERCNCGNIGCLERIASGTAIARRANELIATEEGVELLAFARTLQENTTAGATQDLTSLEPPPLYITARMVGLAAEAGIPIAHTIIGNAAEALGIGLVNIIHIFNPDTIVLGGGVTQLGPTLMEPALRVVQERAMKVPREAVRIVLAQLGINAGLVGAGALIYHYKQ